MQRLRLTEIFYSLQGESKTVGIPTVFVRLTGCPLRCQYCDTAYAFSGGNRWDFSKILNEIKQYQTAYVTVTGGEPLAQPDCFPFLKLLCDEAFNVSLETSGAISIEKVDRRVMIVLDIKTPGSLESNKNLWENLDYLSQKDQIKFVICNRDDYEWSKTILSKYNLHNRCEVLFSPSYSEIAPGVLADWILQDQLSVRYQIQLHKYLWGEAPGR